MIVVSGELSWTVVSPPLAVSSDGFAQENMAAGAPMFGAPAAIAFYIRFGSVALVMVRPVSSSGPREGSHRLRAGECNRHWAASWGIPVVPLAEPESFRESRHFKIDFFR